MSGTASSAPARTAAGWRVYGPEEFARLHQIIALKRLGLSLKRIGEMIAGGAIDLDQVLALQEEALSVQKRTTDRALDLVRRARARLAKGEKPCLRTISSISPRRPS